MLLNLKSFNRKNKIINTALSSILININIVEKIRRITPFERIIIKKKFIIN